jgi:hypothetical protein
MKPITEWELSEKAWTLRDMMSSEVIKQGPLSPLFAHAIYDLMRGRVDDPDISDTDIKNLTTDEISVLSVRMAKQISGIRRATAAVARMASMVNEVHKDSTSS